MLLWLLTDHRGSTSVTSGAQSGNIKYFPYGATRSGAVSTAYKFTGQRLDDSTGLYYYGARYYDAALGRFVQADTIVPQPGNPQALNRYSYTLNNPLKYNDPTGHWVETAFDILSLGMTLNDIRREGLTFWNAVSLVTDVASVALPVVPAGASHAIRAGKVASKAINAADTAADAAKLLNAADTVADTAKLAETAASHTDDVVGAALMAGKKPVVIGENMAGRVNPYAKSIGAETIDDWLGGRTWTQKLNDEYIATVKSQQREVIDIGPDFDRRLQHRIDPTNPSGRPPSSAYGSERRQLLGYDNYRRAFERLGKYEGGLPGFDY